MALAAHTDQWPSRPPRIWTRVVTPLSRRSNGQGQIEQDVVVIAGIERDAVERAGGGDAAQHVERAIAVERCDLDGDDIVDQRKAPPRNRR